MNTLSGSEITTITNTLGELRAKHGFNGLMNQQAISNISQNWANYLISVDSKDIRKSGTKFYSENIYVTEHSDASNIDIINAAITHWYSKGETYNYTTTTFNNSALDFTTLIWKSSLYYGIGIAKNNKRAIVVFNVTPIANNFNTFMGNVKPPIF